MSPTNADAASIIGAAVAFATAAAVAAACAGFVTAAGWVAAAVSGESGRGAGDGEVLVSCSTEMKFVKLAQGESEPSGLLGGGVDWGVGWGVVGLGADCDGGSDCRGLEFCLGAKRFPVKEVEAVAAALLLLGPVDTEAAAVAVGSDFGAAGLVASVGWSNKLVMNDVEEGGLPLGEVGSGDAAVVAGLG